MTQFPISYSYKPKKWIMVVGFFFFALGAYLLIKEAQTNDQGLKLIFINPVWELSFSPSEATLYYWALGTLSSMMSFLGLFNLYLALTSRAKIVLTNKEISIPSSMFNPRKILIIPFKEILSLEYHHVGSIRFLRIVHQKGKIYLNDRFLPKKTMFDEIASILDYNRK